MGPGLTRNFFSENNPKISLNQSDILEWYTICRSILSVYTLLKVFRFCDLSVLSVSVMGFQPKSLDGGWVGGVSS